jgi:hypothetical protein
MPLPRHSDQLGNVQIPAPADLSGLTEIRVHGVGGTPPDTTLGDLTPEQVAGDDVAGFYRTSDRAGRHVEAYSWGGLTSRSSSRLLWLFLLPFMFSNLAGWMCSAATRDSRPRFALHRFAYGLGALALTVNATLIAALISVDDNGYQAVVTGRSARQWWLAPLGWHFVAGHPARQLAVGTVPVLLLLLGLAYLARRSFRYEAVRPPFRGTTEPPPSSAPAAALPGGLADKDFWDGQVSVLALLRLHLAAAVALLTVVLTVTGRAVAGGSGIGWVALAGALGVLGLVVLYMALDSAGALSGPLRGRAPLVLLAVAAAALICAWIFAWLRPPVREPVTGGLPDMSRVTGWTAIAIGIVLALALVSALAGGFRRGTITAGSWVTLLIGLGLLNFLMLSLLIWVAHLVGPVGADPGHKGGALYLPSALTSTAPLLGWAYVIAVVIFAGVQAVRVTSARTLPPDEAAAYQRRADEFIAAQPEQRRVWYQAGGTVWARGVAKRQRVATAPHSAVFLLYGIVVLQAVLALGAWRLHWQAPAPVRYAGTVLGGLLVPALMATLRGAWGNNSRRKHIGILWDVGTFWPRSYHPLSPPCYTERAIPDLQRRLWWLHDNDGQVLIAAHSQGTMLAVAALAQVDRRPLKQDVALATFGSPVIKLYGWAFPGYLRDSVLAPLAPDGGGQVAGWNNFVYPTDPIAAKVGIDSVDVPLPDPPESIFVYGQPPPHPGGHSGYWADPAVWAAIDGMAADFTREPPHLPRVAHARMSRRQRAGGVP